METDERHYPDPERSDERIRADIEAILGRNSWVDFGKIQISVDKGTVTLMGEVYSLAGELSAFSDVWHVPGVLHVNNNLRRNP